MKNLAAIAILGWLLFPKSVGINGNEYYEYRVKATINGKRTITDKGLFRNKQEAANYAKGTNKERPGSNARVVKVLTT